MLLCCCIIVFQKMLYQIVFFIIIQLLFYRINDQPFFPRFFEVFVIYAIMPANIDRWIVEKAVVTNIHCIWLAIRCKKCCRSLFAYCAYFFWDILACGNVVGHSSNPFEISRICWSHARLEVKMWKYGSRPCYKILHHIVALCVALNHLLLKIYSNKCGYMEPYNSFENLWKPLLWIIFRDKNYAWIFLVLIIQIFHVYMIF